MCKHLRGLGRLVAHELQRTAYYRDNAQTPEQRALHAKQFDNLEAAWKSACIANKRKEEGRDGPPPLPDYEYDNAGDRAYDEARDMALSGY